MTAYCSAYGIDQYFTIQMGEAFFNQRSYCLCICQTGRLRNIAFAIIIQATFCVSFHLLDNACNDTLFSADLFTGDQVPFCVHVQKRADLQKCTEEAGSF